MGLKTVLGFSFSFFLPQKVSTRSSSIRYHVLSDSFSKPSVFNDKGGNGHRVTDAERITREGEKKEGNKKKRDGGREGRGRRAMWRCVSNEPWQMYSRTVCETSSPPSLSQMCRLSTFQ